MESHPRISELLVETGAFTDLDEPVILTSGELGIYYVNTEKLLQDGGEWKNYGENSRTMIDHAIRMTKEHPTFGEVIDILAEKAKIIIDSSKKADSYTISGGQRRDWIFSGPVAKKLNLSHISIYKDGKIQVLPFNTGRGESPISGNTLDLHIADLLTEASSCYTQENGEEKGWVPCLRKEGIKINDLMTVVTRLQGGEERLAGIKVTTHPFVATDKDFLRQHSKNPDKALAYNQNPTTWSRDYLQHNGALALIKTFDPEAGKLDRARKFLDRYGDVLAKANKWEELDREVSKKYRMHLSDILGGTD